MRRQDQLIRIQNEQLTTRLKSAQRKSTLHMAEIHPELKFIRDEIIKSEDGNINIEAALEKLAQAERQRLAEEIIEEVQQKNVEEGTTGDDLGHDMEVEEEE